MNRNISEAVRCAKHSEHYDIMYLAQAVGELLEYQNIGKLDAALGQPEQEPVAVPQFRIQGCSNWYDGYPDYLDGGGTYETRTLYTTPPQLKPLSDEQTIILKNTTCPEIDWKARHGVEMNNGERNQWMLDWFRAFKVAIEAAHGIQE